MKETHTFLVPDYFPRFACKMGACRTACCTGWPVTVSRENYFHLLGVDCSPDLRRRIDCALHLVDYPTPDAYARFDHRWDGECAARLPDGRCAIQAELGEDLLADVCRLYPRGVRFEEDGGHECSCANSCEATVEAFFDRTAPLRFVEHTMAMSLPTPPRREAGFETLGRARDIRLYLIALMQERALSLPARLARLGTALDGLATILSAHNADALDALLAGKTPLPLPAPPTIDDARLRDGLTIAGQMLTTLAPASDSIRAIGEQALDRLGEGEALLDRYRDTADTFAARFPDWACWIEHLLINHMFFAQFPYQGRPETLPDAHIALCATYAILRFLLLGAAPQTRDDAADIAAALFRLVEHADFDRQALRLLHRLDATTPERLWALISF